MAVSERAKKRELASLRKLVARAHERALCDALTALEGRFAAWRERRIDAFQLNDEIHQFHQGVSRELYKHYVMSPTELAAYIGFANAVIDAEELEVPRRLQFEQMLQDSRMNGSVQPEETD